MAKNLKTIINSDLKELERDRDEFIERLKHFYPSDKNKKEFEFMIDTILSENLIIDEFKDTLKRAEGSK